MALKVAMIGAGSIGFTRRLMQDLLAVPEYPRTEKVRVDVLRRFGYCSTESNGHLSEYVPLYRKRTNEINKWIDLGCWINGETSGYPRVCTEGRTWFETDFPNRLKEIPSKFGAQKRWESVLRMLCSCCGMFDN
jgi:alpha-galactosidase